MQTHVFDVHGPYALFRKPYSPVSPVSFPFPPPPTVMGMIGAICGYGKDTYLEQVGWDRVKVGVGIRKPIRRLRTGINLINTKEGNFYDAVGENQRIQIPHEFLKDVRFRIYVADGPEGMMSALGAHLEAGTNIYTVSLGLSECLAEFEYVGTFESRLVSTGRHPVDTVVPEGRQERVYYQSPKEDAAPLKYGHYRVPVRMDPRREVRSYQVAIAEENGHPIEVETGDAYRVGDNHVLFF